MERDAIRLALTGDEAPGRRVSVEITVSPGLHVITLRKAREMMDAASRMVGGDARLHGFRLDTGWAVEHMALVAGEAAGCLALSGRVYWMAGVVPGVFGAVPPEILEERRARFVEWVATWPGRSGAVSATPAGVGDLGGCSGGVGLRPQPPANGCDPFGVKGGNHG